MRQEWHLEVGMRVQVGADRGTVAYVGKLQGRGDSVWVGVEWDRLERGKHDGTADGIRYWQCDGPRGSFVKMKKVGNGGRCSLIDAVRRRYEQEVKDEAFRRDFMRVGGGVVQIADKKVPRLSELEVVDVSEHGVCSVGDVSELERVTEVTLSKCLFGRMSEVCEVVRRLSTVRSLDASHNVLTLHEDEEPIVQACDSSLEEAILNHCRLSWEGVVQLCGSVRALRVLRLHDCALRSLSGSTMLSLRTSLHALEKVDVDGNRLHWDDVLALGQLPSLREAYVSNNALQDRAIERAGAFAQLRALSLADNQLDGWRVVDWLNSLPRLTQLWLRGNGILRDDAAAEAADSAPPGRLRAVARIASLQKLDGSAISADERLFAERRYAREVAADAASLGVVAARKLHARLEELLPLADARARARSGAMRDAMVTVRVDGDGIALHRQLPAATPLRRALRIVQRAVRRRVALGVLRNNGHVHWLRNAAPDDDDDDELLNVALSQLATTGGEHVSVVAHPL